MANTRTRSRKILELLNVPRVDIKCTSPNSRENLQKFNHNNESNHFKQINNDKCNNSTNSNLLKNNINIISVVTLKSGNLKENINGNATLPNYSGNEGCNFSLGRAKRNLFKTELTENNIKQNDPIGKFKEINDKNHGILQWLGVNNSRTGVSTPEKNFEEKCHTNILSENDHISKPSIYKDSGSEYIPGSSSGSCSEKSEANTNKFGIPSKSNFNLQKSHEQLAKSNGVSNDLKIESNKNIITCMSNMVKAEKQITDLHEVVLQNVLDKERENKQLNDGVHELGCDIEKNLCTESQNDAESNLSLENVAIKKKLSIESSKTNIKSGKRIRDKVHCCLYCDKLLINIARHYELLHKNEIRVARVLSMPKGSRARKEAFDELHKLSNFHHNCEVINKNSGELILVRRPAKNEVSCGFKDYGPCPNCLGFMLKKRIWFHLKYHCKVKVPFSSPKHQRKNIIAESTALLVGMLSNTYSHEYNTNILATFQNDNISDICRTDDVILKFGWTLFEKFGTTQNDLIRQQMRQLARFLLEIKNSNAEVKSIADCLLPNNFDIVIDATRNISGLYRIDVKRPEFRVPSLALKIGHSLKKCAFILRGIALRKGLTKQNELYSSFLTLMDMEWSSKISSQALTTLHKRKFNHKQLLPLTEDLVHLTTYLDKQMSTLMEEMQNNVQYKTWRALASITLSRVILFNKNRSGEAAKMTIHQYATRPSVEDNTQELLMSLSPLERKLASIMEVIDIEGKRGSRVPVIITPKIKSAIDLLIKTRTHVDISQKNPYIFCPINTENGHLRGHECLKAACSDANLRHPELITGTKLRKYVATVSQIFNLGKNESDWLARHMGHDIRVHRNFYRLHENTVEATKISRLLLAIEKGQANKFAGKTLDEITVEELPCLEEEDNDGEDDGGEDDGKFEVEKESEQNYERIEEDSNCDELPRVQLNKKRTREASNKDANNEIKKKKAIAKSRRSCTKRPWSEEEKEAVLKFFKFDLKREHLPGKERCLQCMEKYPNLQNRKWADIKYYLKNYYAKNRRLYSTVI